VQRVSFTRISSSWRVSLACTLTASTLVGGKALAQSAAAPDQLQEIVVTATKRAQNIQDIPISVTAISGDDLDRSGARDFHDVLLSVPGVSYSSAEPGMSRYSIRGISTAASSPTVGIYLNDISLVTISTNFTGAADPMLVDMDRIEVLKGPQGTLYGGSAMGGAIKYVTRQPTFNQFAVTAEGGVATVAHGGVSYDVQSFVNMPLINDQLAIRFGADYRRDAGYIDNVAGGTVSVARQSVTSPPQPYVPYTYTSPSTYRSDNWNSRETVTARASLKWMPIDSLTIVPVATIQRSDKENPDDFYTNLPQFQNTARFSEPLEDHLDVFSLNATQEFSQVSITSLTGYVDRSLHWDRDYSPLVGSLVPILVDVNTYNVSATDTKTFSQELRVASSNPHAWLKWVIGAYYSHQNDDLIQLITTDNAGTILGTGTDVTYLGNQSTLTSQLALFGDVTWSITSQLDLSGGLRWFDIRQWVNGMFDGVLNGGHSEVDGKRSTDVGVTPKGSLTYHFTDGHTVYASGTKGFRQGGPNRFNTDSPLCAPDFQRLGISKAPDSYQPDNLWTYEIGSKNTFGDRRTVVDAAVYYTDWKKIQQQVNLNSCGFQFVGNVGAATVKGAELSVQSALGWGVSLGANGSYTDTRVTQTSPGVSAQVGQPLLDAPLWSGAVYGDYRFLNTTDWSGTLHAEYEYHGRNLREFETTQVVTYPNGTTGTVPDPTQVQAAYHVINANLNFAHGNTEYRLYVDNLSDAAPYLDYDESFGFSRATTIRPRTIGVDVRANF
jgi:outer membrane receptor protein involved in Fe transport